MRRVLGVRLRLESVGEGRGVLDVVGDGEGSRCLPAWVRRRELVGREVRRERRW